MSSAAVVKRTAIAIPVTIGLVGVPALLTVDETMARAMHRSTPIAGFAIQQTTDRPDYHMTPWPGLGVAIAYAIVALVLGMVATDRRDLTA